MITYDSTHYQHLTFDASAVKQPWSNFECSVAVDYFALKQELQQASIAIAICTLIKIIDRMQTQTFALQAS